MNYIFGLLDMIPGLTKHKRVVAAILTALIQGTLALQNGLGQEWIPADVLLNAQGFVGLYGGIGVLHAAAKKRNGG